RNIVVMGTFRVEG
ncbi:unnamed protein product, partial [Rotaria sp. Silwood1]